VPAQIHDAKAAIRWLKAHATRYAIDPPEQSSTVHAVVTRCAPSDLTQFHPDDEDRPGSVLWRLFGGPATTRQPLARLASPVTHIPSSPPSPFLVVHGTQDETVPYRQAQLLVRALHDRGGHATLRTVPGGHHNLLHDPDLPRTDTPWTGLGHEALTFFSEHLSRAVE
jgi:acetyl esterase/lipase